MKCIDAEKIRVLLLDIEGTTTPITFVADKLFPYSKEKLQNYLEENKDQQQTKQDIESLFELYKQEKQNQEVKEEQKLEVVQEFLLEMIAQNRKQTNLKNIQGRIWQKGYEEGEIKGELYEDILPCFEDWRKENKYIYIYSSGSIQAQILLFQYSNKGDLTGYLSGHFDTNIGQKIEKQSYEKILTKIQNENENLKDIQSEQILFVTDRIQEAIAAREANFQTVLSVREGNEPLPEKHQFKIIYSFDQIFIDQSIESSFQQENSDQSNQSLDKNDPQTEREESLILQKQIQQRQEQFREEKRNLNQKEILNEKRNQIIQENKEKN